MLLKIVKDPIVTYIRLGYPGHKRVSLAGPIFIALVVALIFGLWPKSISLFGASGLVTTMSSFLSVLIAFYVGSVGVFVSFPDGKIDKQLDQNEFSPIRNMPATPRRFLLILFGYLFVLSVILYFFGVTSSAFKKVVYQWAGEQFVCLKVVYAFLYTLVASNVVLTTALAVWIMAYKVPFDSTSR